MHHARPPPQHVLQHRQKPLLALPAAACSIQVSSTIAATRSTDGARQRSIAASRTLHCNRCEVSMPLWHFIAIRRLPMTLHCKSGAPMMLHCNSGCPGNVESQHWRSPAMLHCNSGGLVMLHRKTDEPLTAAPHHFPKAQHSVGGPRS